MSNSIIYTARPGLPVMEPIIHSDGDHYMDKIIGWNEDKKTPFDFTGMTFEMRIGSERGFEDADALLVIDNSSFTISQDAVGTAGGVNNVIIIDLEDAFFGKDGEYWQYTRLFDAEGKRFTMRGSPFIIDN